MTRYVVRMMDRMVVLNATDVEVEGEDVCLLNGLQRVAWFPRESVACVYVESYRHG